MRAFEWKIKHVKEQMQRMHSHPKTEFVSSLFICSTYLKKGYYLEARLHVTTQSEH